ncbi:PLP-dependent transferase [Thalassobaculum sp.]|uniref:O-acetylhomoserine aminocarboxypropyltransferase/cysteine synthase family protein n=1 Tax=Thalassobaculum sp. TaxID=2022740 RepID=UPI0032EC36D7
MVTTSKHPQTQALHSGFRADPATGAVAVPIYQTTSFDLESTQNAVELFGLQKLGNIYTRVMNPTTDVLEQRLAAIEGGVAALAVASGQAAITTSITTIAQSGDNIVSGTDLYGGTWNLFAHTLKAMGIDVRFVDPSDPEAFRRAADSRTRAFFGETLPNPKLIPFPIQEVALIGEELGIPLIVDNTAAPLICRPFDHGAHVVVYSATKYIGGHGNSIGGVIVDSGQFDWEKHAERFPALNQPDPSYHGAVWTEVVKTLGPIAYILRARCCVVRDTGACMSPFNAFLFLQGLETLPLRMREHCLNADAVARFLADHPSVTRVIHPSQFSGDARQRATKYLPGGNGGLVGFELAGGIDAGMAFIDRLKLLHHVANIGDARSLAIHPASTTHQQLSAENRQAAGATPGYVRLSVGIEHFDDIKADLAQALDGLDQVAEAA